MRRLAVVFASLVTACAPPAGPQAPRTYGLWCDDGRLVFTWVDPRGIEALEFVDLARRVLGLKITCPPDIGYEGVRVRAFTGDVVRRDELFGFFQERLYEIGIACVVRATTDVILVAMRHPLLDGRQVLTVATRTLQGFRPLPDTAVRTWIPRQADRALDEDLERRLGVAVTRGRDSIGLCGSLVEVRLACEHLRRAGWSLW